MKKFSLILIFFVFCTNSFCTEKYADFKLIGYIPVWNSGAPVYTNKNSIENIDFSKITHAIIAFIESDSSGNKLNLSTNYSVWTSEQALDSIVAISKRNNVKVLISLGTTADGWKMTLNPETRTNFVSSIKRFLIEKNLDGLDLDFEGGWDASAPFYSDEYELLAKELRDSLGNNFYLTAAVGASMTSWDGKTLWTKGFLEILDWINIMVYDLHLWGGAADIRNPSGFDDQVQAAETYKKFIDRKKLVFGVPFYANGWDHDNDKRYANEINWWHSSTNTDSSSWEWYENEVFNYFILDSLFDLHPDADSVLVSDGDKIWLDFEGSGMSFRGSHNGIIYFNGQNLLKKKAKWVIDNDYGGIMIWELGLDVPKSHPRSLLNALAEQFHESTKNIYSSIHTKATKIANADFSVSLQNKTLKISFTSVKPAKITIADSRGRLLLSRETNTKEVYIQLNKKQFADGIYLLSISQNGAVKSINFLLKSSPYSHTLKHKQ
jgi:chitinase